MKIDLKFKNYRCFSTETPVHLTLDDGFSAFVGINNAGKSSLLKFFYEMRPLFRELCQVPTLQSLLAGGFILIQGVPEVVDVENFFYNNNENRMEIEIEISGIPGDANSSVVTSAVLIAERSTKRWTAQFWSPNKQITIATQALFNVAWKEYEFVANGKHIAHFKEFCEACKILAAGYYIPSFRHITAFSPVNPNQNSYYDISVGRPFIEMWHHLQLGDSSASRRQIHTLIDQIRRVFGFKELQISPSENGNTLQLIIDSQPFSLQELGAGLAQFILVLGNAAFRNPSIILIDEPELSLHPSLQVKFLMNLGSYASMGMLFATHNIGLARSVADEIYSVEPAESGARVLGIDKSPRLAELLGELNYEGYRPLGFSKLLLVEGRTSFKLFVELLRILNKDHEFLVVTMSDLITQNSKEELQEVTRVCPNVFAVIDSEKHTQEAALEPGRQAFAKNCADIRIDCHVLAYRAIENYLSDRAIKEVMGPTYRALTPYEGRQGIQLWHKRENWKIARRMNRDELVATDLGQFFLRI